MSAAAAIEEEDDVGELRVRTRRRLAEAPDRDFRPLAARVTDLADTLDAASARLRAIADEMMAEAEDPVEAPPER